MNKKIMKWSCLSQLGGTTVVLVPCFILLFLFTDTVKRLNEQKDFSNRNERDIKRLPRSSKEDTSRIKHTVYYNSFGHSQTSPTKKQFLTMKHPHQNCDSDTFLLIGVFSSPQNIERRNVIRNTWGSREILEKYHVRLVFLLGDIAPEFVSLSNFITREHKKHKDILQHKYIDNYKSLTLKSILLVQWVLGHCTEAKYLLKADEDVIVHVPNLVNFLKVNKCENCFVGQKITNAKPIRDRKAKWYISMETYHKQYYPPYLSGTAYVIPTAILTKLNHVILHTKPFWLEDIYVTGICAVKAGGLLVHNDRFSGVMLKKKPVCDPSFISSHGFTSQEMRECWFLLNKSI